MNGTSGENNWELLEMIGAYAADELDSEEARETERLLLANGDRQRLVESYTRMFRPALGDGRGISRGAERRYQLCHPAGLRLGLFPAGGGHLR